MQLPRCTAGRKRDWWATVQAALAAGAAAALPAALPRESRPHWWCLLEGADPHQAPPAVRHALLPAALQASARLARARCRGGRAGALPQPPAPPAAATACLQAAPPPAAALPAAAAERHAGQLPNPQNQRDPPEPLPAAQLQGQRQRQAGPARAACRAHRQLAPAGAAMPAPSARPRHFRRARRELQRGALSAAGAPGQPWLRGWQTVQPCAGRVGVGWGVGVWGRSQCVAQWGRT